MSRALDLVHDPEDTFIADTRQKFQEVRDYLSKEMREMDLPWEPLPCPSGYFLMADVTKCRNLIPPVYFETHEYEPGHTAEAAQASDHIVKNTLYMPQAAGDDSKPVIPLNLAFVRWMAIENGVTMMPNCFFYHRDSANISENHVRLAICKQLDAVKAVCEKLRTIKVETK